MIGRFPFSVHVADDGAILLDRLFERGQMPTEACVDRERLENLLSAATAGTSGAVDSAPKGPENRPHEYTYNLNPHPEPDTVMAREECKPPPGASVPTQAPTEWPTRPQEASLAKAARIDGMVLRLTTDEVVRLAPRLRPYLTSPVPSWPEVVDAADWLRSELGVSKPLWGEACLAMGREEAAIAVAIVSSRASQRVISGPRRGGISTEW